MEGHERGTDPLALLGWRVEYLAHSSLPINWKRKMKKLREKEARISYKIIKKKKTTIFKKFNHQIFESILKMHFLTLKNLL